MGVDERRLLSQFERKGRSERATVAPVDEEYQAFKAVDLEQPTLFIRPVSQPCQWVNYRYWLHTVADTEWTRLDVIFSFLVVVVTGRNLLGIGEAIGKGQCKAIYQFDPARWVKPTDSKAPFVESITYVMKRASKEAEKESA